jgi:hypothetical protein
MTRVWSWLDRYLAPGPIADGSRHTTIISFAGKLRYRGTDLRKILSVLREVNRDRCVPPLPDWDLIALSAQAARRTPTIADDGQPTEADGPEPFSEEALFPDVRQARWLFHNDHAEWHWLLDEDDPNPSPCRLSRTT